MPGLGIQARLEPDASEQRTQVLESHAGTSTALDAAHPSVRSPDGTSDFPLAQTGGDPCQACFFEDPFDGQPCHPPPTVSRPFANAHGAMMSRRSHRPIHSHLPGAYPPAIRQMAISVLCRLGRAESGPRAAHRAAGSQRYAVDWVDTGPTTHDQEA